MDGRTEKRLADAIPRSA